MTDLASLIDHHHVEIARYTVMLRKLQARLARLKVRHTDRQIELFSRDLMRFQILEDQNDARREHIYSLLKETP